MRTSGTLNIRPLYLLVPWIALVGKALRPIRDNSFLWHIEAGAMQSEFGSVLREDPFSFTFHGEPWRTQSWLVELGYSWMHVRFGLWFVPIWIVALGCILLMAIGIRAYARSEGSILATAGVLVAVSWMGLAFLAPRPVLVSFAALSLIAVASEHRALGWVTPILFWIWAASHGSFVLGIGYLILQWLRTRDRRFGTLVVFSTVAATLTAHGINVWTVLWSFLRNRDALEVIQEWAPPEILHVAMWPYAVITILLLVQVARQTITLADLWVVGPFLIFGLTSQRALFLAALVLAPWAVGRPSVERPSESRTSSSLLAVGAAGIFLALLPFALSPLRPQLDEEFFPVAAAAYLTEERAFHDGATGGFLIYAGGGRRVLVDDRAELYGREFFDRAIEARSGAAGWKSFFDEHGISQALVKVDDGAVEALAEAGWIRHYADESFVLMRAPGTGN
jgi:hypothetical protein